MTWEARLRAMRGCAQRRQDYLLRSGIFHVVLNPRIAPRWAAHAFLGQGDPAAEAGLLLRGTPGLWKCKHCSEGSPASALLGSCWERSPLDWADFSLVLKVCPVTGFFFLTILSVPEQCRLCHEDGEVTGISPCA